MSEKMRISFIDDSDHGQVSTRFWSHVKSKSKSTRIPEMIKYGERIRSDVKGQANLYSTNTSINNFLKQVNTI